MSLPATAVGVPQESVSQPAPAKLAPVSADIPAAPTPAAAPTTDATPAADVPATVAAATDTEKEVKIPLATSSAPASPANQTRQTAKHSKENSINNIANNDSSSDVVINSMTAPKPPVTAETRLNANAKSFTPAGPPPPPPPPPPPASIPPVNTGGGVVPPHPIQNPQQQMKAPSKQPAPKGNTNNNHQHNSNNNKAMLPLPPPLAGPIAPPPPPSSMKGGIPPMSAAPPAAMPNRNAAPMMPSYPPMQPGKQPMMAPLPGPGAMPPPGMPGGPQPGGYFLPQGFMPPPQMMYGQPGGMPQQAPPPGSMMWMPQPYPQPQPQHQQPQQLPNPSMTQPQQPYPQQQQQQQQQHPPHPPHPGMPMNGMFPMPMSLPPQMQMPGHPGIPQPQQAPPQRAGGTLSMPSSSAHPPGQAPGHKAGVVPSPMPNTSSLNRTPSQLQPPLQPPPPPQQQQQQHPPPMPGAMPPGMMPYFPPPPGMMPAGMPPGMISAPMMAAASMQFQQQQQQQHQNLMSAGASRQASLPPSMASAGSSSMVGPVGGMMVGPPPPPPPPPPPQSVPVANPVSAGTGGGATAQARISVGNATLAALNSKEPPKFSCVLLSGIPAVGKTTLGRELVNSLKTDGMGWAFFSGADFLPEQQGKRSVWETTKDVFDALSTRLDELLEQQRENRNIKGLVIDKNCKGIEDVYYLNALLCSKSIPFVGIVGMECSDDEILVKRMGGDDYLKEKLKFHRVIHARIVNLAKSAGMYRFVDATKSKEEVVQQLRTMVLGCCAQPPSRSIAGHQYEDSRANAVVDDYKEYSEVLTHLFKCVNNRGSQFPGSADLVPFSTKEMTDKNRINALKSRYGIRRKVNGNRYLLLYHQKKLYLVPPHMRAVLQMSLKAWLGTRLDSEKVGTFVLEGDLARLCHDHHKEMFLVYDVLYWSDAENPSNNTMIRMTFSERQSFLAGNMCNEEKAFTGADNECVVVHQPTQKMAAALDMLDSEVYPSDGLVFQVMNPVHRNDHVFVWQQPSCLTADFRVGRLIETRTPLESADSADNNGSSNNDGRRGFSLTPLQAGGGVASSLNVRRTSADIFLDHPVHTFALEVYDKTEKRYVQYEEATMDVRHPDVVEGCIVTCTLVDDIPRRWMFRRIRYDVLRPIYKMDLEELLDSCLIPRAKLVSWLLSEQFVPSEIQPEVHSSTNNSSGGGTNTNANIPSVPPPSYDAAAASAGTMNKNATLMVAMGGASGTMFPLPPPPPPPPASSTTAGMSGLPAPMVPTPPAMPAMPAMAAAAVVAPTNVTGVPARSIFPSASAMLSRVAPAVPAKPVTAAAVTVISSSTTPPAQVAAMSAEQQLQQLASIVPSFHVVDHSKEITASSIASAPLSISATNSASNANTPASASGVCITAATVGGRASPSPNNAITSDGKVSVAARVAAAAAAAAEHSERSCAQCRRAKHSEDLRIDRRDHKHYCYSCWSKFGYGFCVVCGEFKAVRHEMKGRHKGAMLCAACSRTAAAAAGNNNPSANASPAANTNTNTNSDAQQQTPAPTTNNNGAAATAKPALTDEQKAEAEAAKKARKKAAAKEKRAAAAAARRGGTTAPAEGDATAPTATTASAADTMPTQDSGSAATGSPPNAVDGAKKKRKDKKKSSVREVEGRGADGKEATSPVTAEKVEAAAAVERSTEKPLDGKREEVAVVDVPATTTPAVPATATAESEEKEKNSSSTNVSNTKIDKAPAVDVAAPPAPPTTTTTATATAEVKDPSKRETQTEEKKGGGGCRQQ